VFDPDGGLRALAQQEFAQHYPQPGWVEHDPEEIWSSTLAVARAALAQAGLESAQVAGIGITNQRETTVLWDRRTGAPLHRAIVWQDRRTADRCEALRAAGQEDAVRSATGLLLDPYFSGTKLAWLLDTVPDARRRAARGELAFGTIDSWLIWKLTGGRVHVTDATNASRTLLWDLRRNDWSDELCALFDVPRELLPMVVDSSGIVAETDAGLFGGPIPIAGIAGDQQSALIGQACLGSGQSKSTYGTGCFLLMNTGEEFVRSKNNLLTTVAWRIGDKTEYALEGSVFIGGAVVQWVRDELQLVRTAPELDWLASTVKDSNGLYLVPAFAGLGAPHWDPYARGAAVGITRGANRAHFCRAALESIAFQSADLITCMEKDSGLTLTELRVDGGASKSEPLLQFQSDLLNENVLRPKCVETTAIGAAYLAGLAVGFWESREELAKNWVKDVTFEPQREVEEMAKLRKGWDKAVERAKAWEDPVDE
jgi:glycerol kinase